MNIESILAPIFAAASFLKEPLESAASRSVKDTYEAIKNYLEKRLSGNQDAKRALDLALEKPDSTARRALLTEECADAGLETDRSLQALIDELVSLRPFFSQSDQRKVHVHGHGNRVLVAGRDVITAERFVQRSAITPDDRHITADERRQICSLIAELAVRLAADDGRPNFAAGHRMLQQRFEIASYVLLPREKFQEALDFLKQQRAIHRSRLRRRNPLAYQSDLFRVIFAMAGELGWNRQEIYEFGAQKLRLKKPINSLKALGPNQLKTLAGFMRGEIRRSTPRECSTPYSGEDRVRD